MQGFVKDFSLGGETLAGALRHLVSTHRLEGEMEM